MIVVEQFSPQVLEFLDVCYVLEMGQIIYEGSPKTLKEDQDLQQRLLGVG
jgi:ABC-type branched-subunit amino acid transport system ATPase component